MHDVVYKSRIQIQQCNRRLHFACIVHFDTVGWVI